MLKKITGRASGGKKNIFFEINAKIFPKIFAAPEFIINEAKNINGKSDGTRVPKHISKPSFTPKNDKSGRRTRNIPKNIIKIRVSDFFKSSFVLIITLFMNNIYFLCAGEIIC